MRNFLWLLLLLSPLAQSNTVKKAGIDKVFIVPDGFDSNDLIELVVDSTLPDACYKVGKTEFTITDNIVKIEQYIQIKKIIDCTPEHRDTNQFPTIPVRYSKTINIGSLPAGDYQVQYINLGNKQILEKFTVKQAEMNSIDDFHYAPVSNAFIPELIYDNQAAMVVLTGIISNSCMFFNQDDFTVTKYKRLFVIQPKVKFVTNQECIYIQKPLQAIVDLGTITEEGRYLIHVRSMSGQSVNKVFSVLQKQTVVIRERD